MSDAKQSSEPGYSNYHGGSGSDSKPNFGIPQTSPSIKIGEANPGRNYPDALGNMKTDVGGVEGNPIGGGSADTAYSKDSQP